jgi:cyanuric acid amidohydrolase
VKCPLLTSERIGAARARGQSVATEDTYHSMGLSRGASALGVALALGEVAAVPPAAIGTDWSLFSGRASASAGVELTRNEVIVLGNSAAWSGDLQISHRPMRDALDIGAVVDVLGELGIIAMPQVADRQRDLIRAVLVKCEPDRRGAIRGRRHTMLDDTDINAQRHIRGAVGGLVAGVCGETRIFLSGGAEHQGPDGGGLIAVIAASSGREGGLPCAS